ncbi:bifunctional sugar phosphate isomerase/epimerase/4-hydroxyphenylpyruvate dioxygenase family protein [Bergeriella denitrificans]|uniref:3-dehydroshikimate dehydratase n=1 Tax=Bergeriella denitrificans TaxID=494 RepID=A0A378UG96_BERDE|nr:sugar phosphate isomerase/epimerase and 4-hydroxyphenylpyruvate domain-containing protein [Bergeriella denitrificans]STZ76418.1 4-hydroxyphenylpyruvate dioxygenase [Bergeriella denitrificans]
MKHCIATVSLSGTLPEKLRAISAVGFEGVEIFENDLLYFDGSPADIRKMCEDLNLKIMLFQPFRDFEGGPRSKLAQQINRAERKFELMAELGTDRLLVCSNVQADTSTDDALIADDLHRLAETAAKHGMQVGYEALAWGRHVSSYRHAWDLVQTVNHPNLGIILDSFHTLSINDDLSRLKDIPPEKIVFLQIADAPLMKMDVLEWSRHYRNFPGQGELDVAAFLEPIIANGYNGPLSLEVFNDKFRAAPGVSTTSDAMRSLLFLEEQTASRLKNPAGVQAALFSPPAASAFQDTEFLEFAVNDDSAQRIDNILRQFGFQKTGLHKSKNVTLYQQGSINLILNAEPDSLAHAFFNAHGTSVCAAAYKVADADAMYRRAVEYGSIFYEGKVGPNERHIHAIRSPNGGLQYFVDSDIYSADFHMSKFQGRPHICRIDHTAYGVASEAMDSWTLHFAAIFGFQIEDDLTLPDPYGLMKSRVLRSADGRIRLPLNISENQRTIVSRSMASYKGAGLQHVAFASTDIFATVAALRSNGATLLDIPQNYYDDLQARFGLSDEFTAQLREHHLLYDTDGKGGEFLHAYSPLIEDRFFFEVCERRGGYDQYGAANTPVRLVAQDLYWKKHQESAAMR